MCEGGGCVKVGMCEGGGCVKVGMCEGGGVKVGCVKVGCVKVRRTCCNVRRHASLE